jgi:hypothetical protein
MHFSTIDSEEKLYSMCSMTGNGFVLCCILRHSQQSALRIHTIEDYKMYKDNIGVQFVNV